MILQCMTWLILFTVTNNKFTQILVKFTYDHTHTNFRGISKMTEYEKFRDLFVTDIGIQNTLLATNSDDDFLQTAIELGRVRGITMEKEELRTLIELYGGESDSTDAEGNLIPRSKESPICIRLGKLENRPTGSDLGSIISQLKAALRGASSPEERICVW